MRLIQAPTQYLLTSSCATLKWEPTILHNNTVPYLTHGNPKYWDNFIRNKGDKWIYLLSRYHCCGSGSGTGLTRIQNDRLDPDPYSESGSCKQNWAIKIHFFSKFFMIFTYFLKWFLPNKSSLFNKIPTYIFGWKKNKIPTFLVENKNLSKKFQDPDP